MFSNLSLPEFQQLCQSAKRIALCKEIYADRLTPISIAEVFADELQEGVILESGFQKPGVGRYSMLAFGIVAQLCVTGETIEEYKFNQITKHHTPPLSALRQMISELACAGYPSSLEFIGGAIGFIAYDAIRFFENLPEHRGSDKDIPDMIFNFYNTYLIFDHTEQKLTIAVEVEVNDDAEKLYYQTEQRIKELLNRMSNEVRIENQAKSFTTADDLIETDMSDDEFIDLVKQAKQYIEAGDVFQIVLSRRFSKKFTAYPHHIYRALRKISPSPYMFFMPFKNMIILGASPETLINVRHGKARINPIAGTRKSSHYLNNELIEKDLLEDKKECAEHMMLVDVARNDLGSVCEPGTVKVTELKQIKHFSHVSHICSTVEGQLKKEKDAFDALVAAFPAATLVGAPKIRAMQIIDELEKTRRGLYGGAICRFDYHGHLDSCIAIRMALLKDGIATVRAGAGIVYDSNPQSEADETRHKAQAILEAIRLAEEGLI